MLKKLREMKLGAHIDHAHSISIGRLVEKCYLMIVIDGIGFVWPQTCHDRFAHAKGVGHNAKTCAQWLGPVQACLWCL